MFKEYHVLKIFSYLTFQLNTIREQIFASTKISTYENDFKSNTKNMQNIAFFWQSKNVVLAKFSKINKNCLLF